MNKTRAHRSKARDQNQSSDFSIDAYGAKTKEKDECEEQLLAEFAAILTFFISAVAAVTGLAVEQKRFQRKFGLLDLALLGIATHKLSRLTAKDRITGIVRAPFVSYIRSAGEGEVEEDPRGHGIQRGIGTLISCPYCMGPWCATVLGFGFIFAPRVARFFAAILGAVTISDFLHRGYASTKGQEKGR